MSTTTTADTHFNLCYWAKVYREEVPNIKTIKISEGDEKTRKELAEKLAKKAEEVLSLHAEAIKAINEAQAFYAHLGAVERAQNAPPPSPDSAVASGRKN